MIALTNITDILNFNDAFNSTLTVISLIFFGVPAVFVLYYFFKNLNVGSEKKSSKVKGINLEQEDIAEKIAECLHYRSGESLKAFQTDKNKSAYEVYLFFLALHDGLNQKNKRWIICGSYSKTNVVGGVVEKHDNGYVIKTVYGNARIKENEYKLFERNAYYYKGIAYQLGMI